MLQGRFGDLKKDSLRRRQEMILVSDFAIFELVTNAQTIFVGDYTILGKNNNLNIQSFL